MSDTPKEEVRLNVDGQWFMRGNVSNAWFATFREDGGLAEKVPPEMWPVFEALAAALKENDALRHDIARHIAIAAELATAKEEAERDAQRYRWLRARRDANTDEDLEQHSDAMNAVDPDAAIDEAILHANKA